MGKLIYTLNVSLDGFVETADHSLDWSVSDDELLPWFTEHERSMDASLYGRRLWEGMSAVWPTRESDPSATEPMKDYARAWNAKPIIVFSSTLDSVAGNARLVRGDVRDELAKARQEFGGDLNVGGATLASAFIRAGLVDEYRMVVHPVVLGSGTPYFPQLDAPLRLRPVDSKTFKSGVRYLSFVPA